MYIKHGMSKTREYKTWQSMIQRCENPNDPSYKNYGGRGITVCERWHTFENFYADMGIRPKGKIIDRINNEENYELSNCEWSTSAKQAQNRRPVSCGLCKQCWFFAFNLVTGEWDEDNNRGEFAKRHGLNPCHISNCLHKRRNTHKNWEFNFST